MAVRQDDIQVQRPVYPKADHELSDEEIRQRYGGIMNEFVSALQIDSGYAADIIQHGNLINYKQELWAVRMEVTRAESAAQSRCNVDHRETEQFSCTNTSACGFGNCSYAKPEHAHVKVPVTISKKGMHERPRSSSLHPQYRMEDTLQFLLAERGVSWRGDSTQGSRRRIKLDESSVGTERELA